MQGGPGRFTHRLRLGTKLGLLAAAVTTAVLLGTATLTLRLFRGQLLELAAEASSSQSDALRLVLEQQMKAGDLRPLRQLVDALGREPNIDWVAIINAEGHVRITSEPGAIGQQVDKVSADCRVCHERAPADRLRSVTLARAGAEVLRTVTPIANAPACHRCHGEEARLNGVLLVDRSLGPVQRALLSSRTQVIAGSAAGVFALLGTLGLAVEWLVLARLRRLGKVTRQLGAGDLTARAADATRDELGELATDFNAMAQELGVAVAGLTAERRQLEELVDGISDGVVLVDVGLKVVATNRAFAERLPPGVRHGRGTLHAELARAAGFSAEDGATSLAQRALASNQLEKAIVRAGGPRGERFEEIYAQPLRGQDGAVGAAIEVWRDITDRMALEAGLEQSERLAAVGMLASSVAHEVGNPLAAIATAVEGLLRRLDEPGDRQPTELREYLEIVQKQVFRCHQVTERLLGFARVPGRQLTAVDAAAAVREVLALVSPQARLQQVEVRSDVAGPALALADDLLLQQIFLNLVLNALQAMPGGGVLTVVARAGADAISVTIADTGPGFPEAARQHLFQPFRRARPDGSGTGLGLFISEALVRRCEGTLTVEGEPGQGAAFTVRLKRAGAEPEPRA
jgi:signal transduction histidine kinase/HAMP domain-containing protein